MKWKGVRPYSDGTDMQTMTSSTIPETVPRCATKKRLQRCVMCHRAANKLFDPVFVEEYYPDKESDQAKEALRTSKLYQNYCCGACKLFHESLVKGTTDSRGRLFVDRHSNRCTYERP